MHADIHAQADMSVLKKYGKKRPDRDIPCIYVSGRNDLEPNCSFTNFMKPVYLAHAQCVKNGHLHRKENSPVSRTFLSCFD